jgi:TolB-like protein
VTAGDEQRLIRTIARKGFRFVGDVREADASEGFAAPNARTAVSNEASAQVLSLPDSPSIAALPFQNWSGDPEQEYFADGMVEDIITALSRNRWLFVIARNSSFTYKGRAVDVKQVGRELGVRYVLEGSVRKAANRVRITGQLVDATSGVHLWADRFEGPLDDIFELQDQVAMSVVGAITPTLERAEIERAKRKPTESLDAYDYYLRGMTNFHRGTPSARQCRCSTRRHSSTRTSPPPMRWRLGAISGARSTAGWRTELKSPRKVRGWLAGPSRLARTTQSRSHEAAMRWRILPVISMAASR